MDVARRCPPAAGRRGLHDSPAATIATGATDVTACYAISTVTATGTIEGTVIFAPASFSVGEGFPGQSVTSDQRTVEWYTTGSSAELVVSMVDGMSDGGSPTPNTISGSSIFLLVKQAEEFIEVGALNVAQKVADLSPTGTEPGSQLLRIRVDVPSVPGGTYSGTLTFSVR